MKRCAANWGRDVAGITKTMQVLLNARQGADSIAVAGIRQANAARALVAAGLATRYVSQSRVIANETYYDHFRRAYATRQSRADIGGLLYFA